MEVDSGAARVPLDVPRLGGERTNYPREVAEMALAHAIGDKVEAAYRRGDLFEKRRQMMSDWAAFLATPESKGRRCHSDHEEPRLTESGSKRGRKAL